MTRLDKAAQTTHEILKTFGMTTQPPDEKAKEKETYTWRI
jgi:hypothetical protein